MERTPVWWNEINVLGENGNAIVLIYLHNLISETAKHNSQTTQKSLILENKSKVTQKPHRFNFPVTSFEKAMISCWKMHKTLCKRFLGNECSCQRNNLFKQCCTGRIHQRRGGDGSVPGADPFWYWWLFLFFFLCVPTSKSRCSDSHLNDVLLPNGCEKILQTKKNLTGHWPEPNDRSWLRHWHTNESQNCSGLLASIAPHLHRSGNRKRPSDHTARNRNAANRCWDTSEQTLKSIFCRWTFDFNRRRSLVMFWSPFLWPWQSVGPFSSHSRLFGFTRIKALHECCGTILLCFHNFHLGRFRPAKQVHGRVYNLQKNAPIHAEGTSVSSLQKLNEMSIQKMMLGWRSIQVLDQNHLLWDNVPVCCHHKFPPLHFLRPWQMDTRSSGDVSGINHIVISFQWKFPFQNSFPYHLPSTFPAVKQHETFQKEVCLKPTIAFYVAQIGYMFLFQNE